MTTLIAVDGHSLNSGLQKVAQDRNKRSNQSSSRFRIDHGELADFLIRLAGPTQKNEDDYSLNFYTDSEKSTNKSQVMGRVTKYFSEKGYGFIAATDGNSYFFHHNEVINKKSLCEGKEDRYPHPTSFDFQKRIMGKVVTFNPTTNEDGRTKAEEVKLEFGARSLDQFYRLRREPFLEMLEDHGYHIVRCRPSGHSGKAKSVDVGICLDASWELADGDTLVLLSDDPIFSDLVIRLCETDIKVILTIFDTDSSDELREVVLGHGGKVVLLNDHLDDLELVFEDDYEDEDDASQASVALQEV